MTQIEINDRTMQLEEAQELLGQAIELFESAVKGTNQEANANAYTIAQLKIAKDEYHGFLTNDQNIGTYIEALRNGDA